MDCSPPDFSVHGIFQARILEWVAMSSSRGSSQPRIKPTSLTSPALAGTSLTLAPPGKSQNLPYHLHFSLSFHLGVVWRRMGKKDVTCFWFLGFSAAATIEISFFLSFISSINTSLTASVDVLNAKSLWRKWMQKEFIGKNGWHGGY